MNFFPRSIPNMIFVLAATSDQNNIMYWTGYYWTKKQSSAKIYKSFGAILKLKEQETIRASKTWARSVNLTTPATSIEQREHLFVKDVRIEGFELLPLGEKNEENLYEFG